MQLANFIFYLHFASMRVLISGPDCYSLGIVIVLSSCKNFDIL